MKQTLFALQIPVVTIVKGGWASGVKRGQIAITTIERTISLQVFCESGVYVGLVVNPCSEE